MNKIIATASFCLLSSVCFAQLLPNYNSSFYPTVLSAAMGVGQPFLLLQGYAKLQGLTIPNAAGNALVYNGQTYYAYEKYTNPGTATDAIYYVNHSEYAAYGSSVFSPIWPKQMPNALYHNDTFSSYIDCVGYGTRLLSAVGSAQYSNNAYMQLMTGIRKKNVTPFADTGYVASAYEVAAAFPTLPTAANSGWMYVAGGVLPVQIDTYNHTLRKNIHKYTGVNKGGFAKAMAGDILGFGYPPGGESNGHFMVLSAAPVQLDAAGVKALFSNHNVPINNLDSLLGAYRIYAAPLFDCSGKNIHFNDSRKYTSGIGHGTILVLTDINTDVPQGFVFGPQNLNYGVLKTFTLGTTMYAISVGRYIGS